MTNKNNISIDIEINAAGQQQLNQYNKAFESLRTSINNLSKPLSDLDRTLSNLSVSINKISDNNISLSDTIKNVGTGFSSFRSTVEGVGDVLKFVKIHATAANAALTGGISLVLTFLPEIINLVGSFFKGKDAVAQMTEKLKGFNEIMKAANSDAAAQKTKLDLLYKSATDVTKGNEERLESVKLLKEQFPSYFKDLDNEDIKNGKVSQTYNNLTKSIIDNAKAKAALNKITEESAKILDAEYKIKKIRGANGVEKQALEDNVKSSEGQPGGYRHAGRYGTLEREKKESDERASKSIAEAQKIIDNANKLIADYTKMGGGANKIANVTASDSASTNTSLSFNFNNNEKKVGKSKSNKAPTLETLPKEDDGKNELAASIAREAELKLNGYAKEIQAAENHFAQLKEKFKLNKATVEQLEKERVTTLATINQKYQDEELKKLDGYERQLRKIGEEAGKSARELALSQIDEKYRAEEKDLKEAEEASKERLTRLEQLLRTATEAEKASLQAQINTEKQEQNRITNIATGLGTQKANETKKVNNDFDNNDAQGKVDETKQSADEAEQSGHHSKALKLQIELLNQQYDIAVKAAEKQHHDTTKIQENYTKKKIALEEQLTASKIHAGDKFINAALKGSKKDSAIFKAAFMAKKAIAIADTIISTKTAVMDSLTAYSSIPFIGQALGIVQAAFMAAQGASSIAEIAKQKPGFAAGGQFHSDGRGALLPGYSRTDNTNAYLRSGEAVVVSEAMRNPWARNLVSAINVAHGGRDFSISNPGRGYAIGGIFTDGGNANRYYSQPLNDQKDLANTIAYQMVNNFPPVYVDVKDINAQQNILARTVDRVNL